MREPLNQFADRIIRNNEVSEFIRGLIEKGVSPQAIVDATKPEPPKYLTPLDRFRFCGEKNP